MASSKFMESLVGDRAGELHRRIKGEFAWSDDTTADFLTQVGLGLLGGLRNNAALDIARLGQERELFTWVTGLDFGALTDRFGIEAVDALRAARWTAAVVLDSLVSRKREGQQRLAGALNGT